MFDVTDLLAPSTALQGDCHLSILLYVDPGSGALVWQLLAASFFGGLFYARSVIRRIKRLFSANNQQSQQAARNEAPSSTAKSDAE